MTLSTRGYEMDAKPQCSSRRRDWSYYAFDLISSAISDAISLIVWVAVLRATLSARDGLKSITCCLVILCQIGSSICSPETVRVTIPSSS